MRVLPADDATLGETPLRAYGSLTPVGGRLSIAPGLRESGCRILLGLGRLSVYVLESLSRRGLLGSLF